MRKILFFFVLFSTAFSSFSQTQYEDVVYLKNGSIIRGVIIEQIPNQSIKIETTDRNLFVFQLSEIEKFTKEKIEVSKKTDDKVIDKTEALNLYHTAILETGIQVGIGEFGMHRYKFDIVNSYKLNPMFSVGLGVGLRYFFDAEAALIPFYGDLRVDFDKVANLPLSFSFGSGYTLNASQDFKSAGAIILSAANYKLKLNDKIKLSLGLGFDLQQITVYYISYYSVTESQEFSGAFTINAGLNF